MNEADIREILSQFSESDRDAFDSLMNDQSVNIDVNKRHLLRQNFENNFHLNKRNNFKLPCTGFHCNGNDRALNSDDFLSNGNNCPGNTNVLSRKVWQ